MSDQQYSHLLRVLADISDRIDGMATKASLIELETRLERRFEKSDRTHNEAHQQILEAVSMVFEPLERKINTLISVRNEC